MPAPSIGSASHQNLIANLSGPLTAGAIDQELTIDASGAVTVDWATREPLVLAAPRTSLTTGRYVVSVSVGGGSHALPSPCTFAPYTEAGAFLSIYRPGVDAALRTAAPFILQLAVAAIDGDGTQTAVAPVDVAR